MAMLDMMILVMLVLGLWQGFQAGLLRSLVSLFGWLLALILATYLAKPLSPLFVGLVASSELTVVVSFLAIALLVIIILQILLWILSKTLETLKLSFLDKLAGAIFGVGKNLLVILLCISLIAPFIQTSQMWQSAHIAQQLFPYAPFAVKLSKKLATDVANMTTENLDNFSKQLSTFQD